MPGGREPKVVFCTTENEAGHIAAAIDAGADEYIMKPFDQQIVRSKFEEIGFI
jgi:two-component system chemotaxis response regulator CheY